MPSSKIHASKIRVDWEVGYVCVLTAIMCLWAPNEDSSLVANLSMINLVSPKCPQNFQSSNGY